MGRRLSVSSRGASGRKAGAGRFSERTVPGGQIEILFLTADQRRDCASSSIGNCWNENCWSCDYPRNAKSVTSWMDRAKQQYRDLHRTRIKRRDCHDDGPVKRRRCRCQGTDPRRRGLAGRYHRPGWYPLQSLRLRRTAVAQPRTPFAPVVQGDKRHSTWSLRERPKHLSRGAQTHHRQISGLIAARHAGNIKIIYLPCQSAYVAQTNRLLCTKLGTGTVQFLIERFALLGFEGQYWMLIVAGLIAVFIFFVWRTRHRN
jgi:hypothetical protein